MKLLIDSPPSVNALYPTGRDGLRHLSPVYASWRKAQGNNLVSQRVKAIHGPVRLIYTVAEPSGTDLGNHEKAATDMLVHFDLIDGDGPKVVREIILRWGEVPRLFGMTMGCMIEVESLG